MAKKQPFNQATTLFGESIWFAPLYNRVNACFFGIGKVLRVAKSEEYDIVDVQFTPVDTVNHTKPRQIIVGGNHPRRQLLTIKKGQYALFYGFAYQKIVDKIITANNKEIPVKKWQLFAYAIQGLYVPTAFDVKKAKKENVDETLFSEMSEGEKSLFDNVLSELEDYKGDGYNEE